MVFSRWYQSISGRKFFSIVGRARFFVWSLKQPTSSTVMNNGDIIEHPLIFSSLNLSSAFNFIWEELIDTSKPSSQARLYLSKSFYCIITTLKQILNLMGPLERIVIALLKQVEPGMIICNFLQGETKPANPIIWKQKLVWKLTAWPLSKANIIKSNITSEALSSDGFDENLADHSYRWKYPFFSTLSLPRSHL